MKAIKISAFTSNSSIIMNGDDDGAKLLGIYNILVNMKVIMRNGYDDEILYMGYMFGFTEMNNHEWNSLEFPSNATSINMILLSFPCVIPCLDVISAIPRKQVWRGHYVSSNIAFMDTNKHLIIV